MTDAPGPGPATDQITRILRELEDGDPRAREEAWTTLYGEVLRLARAQRRRWHGDWTLETCDLANEAYLRFFGRSMPSFEDRRAFFAAVSQVIRRILVNYADRRLALKRGGGLVRVSLRDGDGAEMCGATAQRVRELHEALERFEELDPRAAEVVRLRFFVGLTESEVADLLGVSRSTVSRDWATARSWVWRALTAEDSADQGRGAEDGSSGQSSR